MLSGLAPEVALASLLQLAFDNELDESRYPEIRSINVDRKAPPGCFWRSAGRTVRCPQAGRASAARVRLPDGKIGDLRVLESYSFVSVPFSEAREAIRRLNDIHRGGRPIARLAKESAPQKDFRARSACRKQRRGSEYGRPPRSPSCPGKRNGQPLVAGKSRPSSRSNGTRSAGARAPSPKKEAAGAARAGSTGERSRRSERSADSRPCARRVTNWHGN